jgi:S-adenosylmethionine-diacylglycerol 3-amino-3-carboxypropyl transferase
MTVRTEILEKADFGGIRYAQCWEDADVLLEAMQVQGTDTCLSVASAGDNTLALVGVGAQRVIAVDLSPAQIACLELRAAAYRVLTWSQLLELLGQNASTQREDLYLRCRSLLSADSRCFWDGNPRLIRQGIAQGGKFERYLSFFRRFVLPLVHGRKTIEKLFTLRTEEERQAFYDERWNNRRFNLLCRIFFARLSLGWGGRDPSFTQYGDEPVWISLRRQIPNAFIKQQPADNPYLQWILFGRFVTALPWALREENFGKIRSNLDALEWRCDSIEQVLSELPRNSLNGCNLSDVFEYMSPAAYATFLRAIIRVASPGCRLVYWNVVVERHCPNELTHAVSRKRDFARQLHRRDKAFFYRDLVVEEVL